MPTILGVAPGVGDLVHAGIVRMEGHLEAFVAQRRHQVRLGPTAHLVGVALRGVRGLVTGKREDVELVRLGYRYMIQYI